MSENQTVEDYPCRRSRAFIGEIDASLNIDNSFRCGRTVARGVLGGCMQSIQALSQWILRFVIVVRARHTRSRGML